MGAAQVTLKQEVTRNDALIIQGWMEDREVIRYLNEAADISDAISRAVSRVNMLIMTHLFNQCGSFFIVCNSGKQPIGFLRLVHRGNEAEMVIVIGDRSNWGNGLGTAAIFQGLRHAFFEWRIPRVVAKISPDNLSSVKAFEKAGFQCRKELAQLRLFHITQEDYIRQLLEA
jgi:RimJ/RimL family protein N-acetyltransferase